MVTLENSAGLVLALQRRERAYVLSLLMQQEAIGQGVGNKYTSIYLHGTNTVSQTHTHARTHPHSESTPTHPHRCRVHGATVFVSHTLPRAIDAGGAK